MKSFDERTILRKTGTRFKDNGQIDSSKYGHPVMLPIASDDQNMNTYYLFCDSNPNKYIKYGNAYYPIENWQEAGLLFPTVINMKVIYKGKVHERVYGSLTLEDFEDALQQFKEYQSEHPDEYYDEIKNKL